MASNPQCARWTFTWNNYTEDDVKQLQSVVHGGTLRYLVFGRERASTGTPHLQGYVEFVRSVRRTTAQRTLGNDTMHMEPASGTAAQNLVYCSKESEPFVWGKPGGPSGRRSDLEGLVELVRSGADLRRVCEQLPAAVVKYPKGVQTLLDNLTPYRKDWATQFVWRYGRAGTSKSRTNLKEMYQMYPNSWCTISISGGRFFNGYVSGSKGAILDDYAGDLPIAGLLRLFDYTPITVDVKGGSAKWNTRIVWISSQESPEYYYQGQVSWPALKRRISEFGQVFHHERTLNWETRVYEEVVTERNYDDWKEE